MFSNLLKLYKNSSINTPTEDFTTEVLAGILNSNQGILDAFVNTALKIEGVNFKVETQKHFNNCIIDMVFENDDTLCFLENKVNSPEGHKQLLKYSNILAEKNKTVFLRYCTKFIDNKSPEDYLPLVNDQFLQLRWVDVYCFFNKQERTYLTSLFITFLKDNDMNTIPEFKIEDIMAFQQFTSTIKKMDACFEIVKPQLESLGGSAPFVQNSQLSLFRSYPLVKKNVLSEGYSELTIAFDFEEEDEVRVHVQCLCTERNKNFNEFKNIIESNSHNLGPDIRHRNQDGWFWAFFQKNLSDFLSEDNPQKEITDWFKLKIEMWKEFMKSTEDSLEWTHLKKPS